MNEKIRKKIELVLLVLILKSAAEAVLELVKHGVEEIGMPAEAAGFLHDLLSTHPRAEVSHFYCHELDELE
jgi:hypothetical protein